VRIHSGRKLASPSNRPPKLRFVTGFPRFVAAGWKRPSPLPKLTPSNKQSRGSKPTETESIMSIHTVFTAAVLTAAAVAAQAAPQATVKLERVVVTGKASREVAQLPRVVVTGTAQREVAQLPRVVVIGYSEATLARQTLAATKSNAKRG
jgi:hypothetical protein